MTETKGVKTKICLVGDPAVGKTSLIARYVLDEFSDRYLTTIGTKVTKKEVEVAFPARGLRVQLDLMIWDIMGQQGFRELLRDAYFHGAHGILAVADMTRRETLDGLYGWIDSVYRVVSQLPVVIAVNKADLAEEAKFDGAEVAPLVHAFEGEFLMTSAKTGANVEAAFLRLGRSVLERQLHTP